MKTITFYSYKGGVGRSLALSNIAIRLSEFGKKVCVLDFDLEAPGLGFKFQNYKPSKIIETGIVDYIYQFSYEGRVPESIKKHSITLNPGNKIFKPITFIPAGNIDNTNYWKKLSAIRWADMFYEKESRGVQFFLDMKAKIEKEIKPDFLLIDSRTGITDIAGITLRLLADEVVILAANNKENIWGSKKIINNLLDESNALFNHLPKVNFVLTRLPFKDTPHDKAKKFDLLEKLKIEFNNYLKIKDFKISVIHSDSRLEIDEKPLIGYEYDEKQISISNDYLKLFDKLTSDILTPDEIELFKRKKLAEKLFSQSREEKSILKKMTLLNKAIELDSSQYDYYRERGDIFFKQGNYDSALNDYEEALFLSPIDAGLHVNIGFIYLKDNKKDFKKAIECFDRALFLNYSISEAYYGKFFVYIKSLEVEKALITLTHLLKIHPNDSNALNSRADLYRQLGDYNKAYLDIYKAIELDSNNPIYFGTLAEIYAMEGKIEEFYMNFTIALSKGIDGKTLNSAKDVYEKFKNDERFVNLINKYNIEIEEILNESEIEIE